MPVPLQVTHSLSAENNGPKPRVYFRFRTRKACCDGDIVASSSSFRKDESGRSVAVGGGDDEVEGVVSFCDAEVRRVSVDEVIVVERVFMR